VWGRADPAGWACLARGRGRPTRYRCHGHAYPETGGRQYKHLQFGHGFRVALGDDHGQAAPMTLGHGEKEGGQDIR
jgi:hypothetical protein